MAHLKQIDIENFKSWRGKQVIGPFMRFNCIIGTNGSGKSNLMDALSFVMGERASALRVKHLGDLIHGAHVGRPVSRTARVSMRYCDEKGVETEFSRSISGDSSEYRINDARVTFSVYSEELLNIGIITKTQNCLVFQGAVESIALKDPKERTKMFEYISQSRDYAAEYSLKKEALQKAKEDSQLHFIKKRSAAAEKKQASQEKLEAQRYQVLVDELDQNRLKLSLAELFNNQQSIDAVNDTLTERQSAAAAKKEELESWEQTVSAHKREVGRLTRELQHIEKEIRQVPLWL
uniref:RecF/RecN/SMC N-terminal domain-containing protein n=1 Tax=Salarias fasciatus TaxID=181472 RepID=A0A672GJ98_SALFA